MALLLETLNLANANLKTKNGKGFSIIYVDPKTSTDNIYDKKELLKKYGMEYLPYNRYIKYVRGVPHAWGWLIWDGQESQIYPLVRKFAEEIGAQETPPENGKAREIEAVLSTIEQIKPLIMQAGASSSDVDSDGIIGKAEELKKRLAQGIGSKETMDALNELVKFRMEMKRHMGHPLSLMNTILVWLQKPNATDVRSRGEWKDMGYTPKEGATPIILSMPARFKSFYGAKYDEIVRAFLEKEKVKLISDLTPSQKRRLDRETKYPDPKSGFKGYIAFDISDMVAGPNAEQFPTNNFKWYDADSEATSKEERLIKAVIEFGESLGIKYEYKDINALGGARGYASAKGDVAIADDKRNKGLLSTVIHETGHQIMHWEVVKTKNPRLVKFYFGGTNRGNQIVEQEAELCAWIVLSAFGYRENQEHFNYLANWGMNVENCNNVFDQVFKVAEYVYDGVTAILNNQNQQN